MKNLLKKVIAALLVFCIAVSCNTVFISASSSSDKAGKAYKKYIEKLKTQKKYKDGIYTATVKSGKGSDVLIVTDAVFNYEGKNAVCAYIYQYVKGKVVYIGEICSTGTGYPLCEKDGYILAGYHHSSEKLIVNNGKGEGCIVDGIYLDGRKKAELKKYTMKNGNKKIISSKKIAVSKAEAMDYYYDENSGGMRGTPIKFK